jgi:uncharacterized protein
MQYPRTLSKVIEQVSASFPVVLVTGPRQVGKTTMLEHTANQRYHYVSLDDMQQRQLASSDPELFLKINPWPLIIDEVQYAPELFSCIKIAVDREKKPGMYWLTGSQKFHLMQHITESLAGRVAILDLLGFSQMESNKRANQAIPFLPDTKMLDARAARATTPTHKELFKALWRGSFPKTVTDVNMNHEVFYSSYIQTYINRDVGDILKISNPLTFNTFIQVVAARTGQLLNYHDIARDSDIDQRTAKKWISILEASGIIYLLQPYHNNLTKRLIKTPKVYFLDTGLCCHLTRWTSPETLKAGAMSGAIFETFVITEIIKSYWHNGKKPPIYFYRDTDKKEIDLIIEQDGALHPIEIKQSSNPGAKAGKNFAMLKTTNKTIGTGAVICQAERLMPLSKDVIIVPAQCI